MSKKGQYSVFSARTTPEGLRILGELKASLGLNWDRLIIDAVNAHYNVAVPMPILVGPTPEERAAAKAQKAAEKAERAEARAKAAAEKKAEKAKAEKKGKKAEAPAVIGTIEAEGAAEPEAKAEKPARAKKLSRAERKAKKAAERKAKGEVVRRIEVKGPEGPVLVRKTQAQLEKEAIGEVKVYDKNGRLVRTEDAKGETVSVVETKS